MDNRFYQCGPNDDYPMPGLLGAGALPYPEVIPHYSPPPIMDVGGYYATDELSAAMVLATNLAEADTEATPEEMEEDLGLLVMLYAQLKQKGYATAAELETLRKRAEAIPVVGAYLFSAASLPGTLASVGGILHAVSQSKRVIDLLDIPESLKKELRNWAATRGKPGAHSAKKAFRQRIKIAYVNGNLMFKIPVSTVAPYYALKTLTGDGHIHLPAYGNEAYRALNARVTPNTAMYGTKGIGRVLGSNWLSAMLTIGPQAVIDGANSATMREFAERSAYSQPSNVAVFATGVFVTGIAAAVGAPVIITFAAVLGAGMVAQFVLDRSGFNDWAGDTIMRAMK